MHRLFAPAALAAVMLAVLPAIAFADEDTNDASGIPLGLADPSAGTTIFDLGIDVSGVPHTATAVKQFIGTLQPETQSAVMGACEQFMQDPSDITSPDTYAFCSSAVRG
jgi:hypothetical protein